MKKAKWHALAMIAGAMALVFGSFAGCSNDGGGGNGGGQSDPNVGGGTPSTSIESTHLVDFSGSGVTWDAATNSFINNAATEQYVVYNHKVDLQNDSVELSAKVTFNTLSGHVGVGFISVDGLNRKGYQLLTGQNIKNVGCTEGGSGQGFDTKAEGFAWSATGTYVFKVTIANGKISYVVYDVDGTTELAAKRDTTIYHAASDIVYPAFGGTRGNAATYSEISVTVNGVTKEIDGIDPQNQLSTLSLDKSIIRIKSTETGTVQATATEKGSTVPVTAKSSDESVVTVGVDSNNVITVTPRKTGEASVTVTHSTATYLTASFDVVVADYPTANAYGSLASVTYPAAASTDAYEDATLTITFDSAPTLSDGGFIDIYEKVTTPAAEEGGTATVSATLVDTITMIDERQTAPSGNDIYVGSQLVRVDGNKVLITPHFGTLKAGKTYFVAIPENAITGKINGADFNGLSNDVNAENGWSFTVRAAQTISNTITVNCDPTDTSANFKSLNGALTAIGSSAGEYTIQLAKGEYYELINVKPSATITIEGATADAADTVISYINHNAWNGSTAIRPSFYVGGGNLVLKNVTIWNKTRRGVDTQAQEAQAEAIYFQSTGTLAAYNCAFKSYQDTIQVGSKGGKAWFYKCYIEGDVDYIWGTADVALFEECEFKTLNDSARTTKTSDLIVARTYNTNNKVGKGFVLLNSSIEVEDGMTQTFGRCAGSGAFYDQAAVVNTKVTGNLGTSFWSTGTYVPYTDLEEHVGWKDYKITDGSRNALTPTNRPARTTAMSDTVYGAEYNGRRAILNRVYDVENKTYVKGSEWKLEDLETAFSASEDASKNNVYDEEPAGSYMVQIQGDGTFTDVDMSVLVNGSNANGHGAEIKSTGTTSVTIMLPAGSYVLGAGTCKYGTADAETDEAGAKAYVLTCANTDFTQEYIGTHTYATEDCYNPSSSRTDLYADWYFVKSASDMTITLNSASGVKEYLPFIKAIKSPKNFVTLTDNGTFTKDDITVVATGCGSNNHGANMNVNSVVTISIPAGSYLLGAGTCKYGAKAPYTLTCTNEDFTQEYIGTHTYATEDCYNPSSNRTDLYGDYYIVKSASAMEITLKATGTEYLPFVFIEK